MRLLLLINTVFLAQVVQEWTDASDLLVFGYFCGPVFRLIFHKFITGLAGSSGEILHSQSNSAKGIGLNSVTYDLIRV
jgi:hypothetical protein